VGTTLKLTPSGLELVEHVRAMNDAATRVSLAATGHSESVVGSVCITASEAIAAYLLPPILARLRTEHPGIEIEIVASNQPRDLHRREADIAIRNFRTTQPDLIAQKIKDSWARMYASPAYVRRLGRLRTVKDLSRAELFAFDRTDRMIDGLRALGVDVARAQF